MKSLFLLMLFATFSYAQEVYATFYVYPQKEANLAFTAGGLVKRVNVNVDDVVKKNQLLAVLCNNDIKAVLDGAKTTLKFAKRELQRQKKIQNLIDQGKFDRVQSNYEKAKSNVAYQQALYEKTFLKAPFDGVIYEKNIEVGDAVSGMMLKTVFKIQSQHQRKLVLEFDQKYHNQVKVGDKFIYKLDGETKQREGVISKIYPYANKQNAKIKAEVQAKDIVVGLFGDGQIIVNGE